MAGLAVWNINILHKDSTCDMTMYTVMYDNKNHSAWHSTITDNRADKRREPSHRNHQYGVTQIK